MITITRLTIFLLGVVLGYELGSHYRVTAQLTHPGEPSPNDLARWNREQRDNALRSSTGAGSWRGSTTPGGRFTNVHES